jgi:cell division protein FtsI (penicillin-binding protein 3)
VVKGTASKLYSRTFRWQVKQGQHSDYGKDGGSGKYYASSFVGYFPADNPKYSCIVVHKPSTVNNNYYGMLRACF